jgi:hypothetical protein
MECNRLWCYNIVYNRYIIWRCFPKYWRKYNMAMCWCSVRKYNDM